MLNKELIMSYSEPPPPPPSLTINRSFSGGRKAVIVVYINGTQRVVIPDHEGEHTYTLDKSGKTYIEYTEYSGSGRAYEAVRNVYNFIWDSSKKRYVMLHKDRDCEMVTGVVPDV